VLICSGSQPSDHHSAQGHPERPDRLTATLSGLADLHLDDDRIDLEATAATVEQVALVHRPDYLAWLAEFCARGGGDIDADTYARPESWHEALLAAGAGLAVIDELGRGGEGVGFVAVRPPGHHALADRAMGFCLMNNVAIAAATLAERGERVVIVDWDVHHGNGTQAIFWDDPRVAYCSTHQWPYYPGTGGAAETGGPDAPDLTMNVPLPAGATGDVLQHALHEVIAPWVERFAPTWVLVSAGFDAHRDDPLADFSLSSGDFAAMATTVAEFAPGPGRLALFLEGGYNLSALRNSVAATVGALVGQPVQAEPETTGGPGRDQVLELATLRRRTTA
jgi:acetoin utilization deacetylase AcuC-like enzyme